MRANKLAFDAGAISLYYAGDKRIKSYFDSVFSKTKMGFVSEVNLAEFYYKTAEKFGLQTAETRYRLTRGSQIIVAPDEMITRDAAKLKLKYHAKLSLADCFAISTAVNNQCTLITTDASIKQVKEVTTMHLSL
ncbi:MAG: PIN domain-containing protein [Candidatus Nitrosotenuis sp.]